MSSQSDYETLGVGESASFEEIQSARAKLAKEHAENNQRLQEIEKAYDALLMERLRLRQEGKIEVPDGVRFAEDKPVAPPAPAKPAFTLPNWDNDFSATPELWDWLAPTVAYVALIGLTIGFGKNPQGLQTWLGLGTGAALFFVYRKENRILRAILFSFGGLILGYTIGLAVASALISAFPGLPGPQVVSTWVIFVILWLVSVLLK
ncbi:CPP1-like family protein [filamentous cyanobacterium LEGE 11480]|uniref:CPP1-like family protein n=1 Tax=Romeriopsis navalis LEGE 11480 TaxID=2777977 RepID=A0A928VSE2_9CYAN|nr:CPP1-like family protein [Romeriopsis navalis]MBE9032892.1 CPP1-like family protein [Romeriopsis navalis LEGE 11480]